jgi:hypothetical protein
MKRYIQHISLSLILIFFPIFLNAQSPMNWTRDEINPGEDFTLTPDESLFTEGMKSMHMQLNSGAVPYLVSDVFYITPGADYEFSIDVFDNDTAGTIKVYADFYDTYGFNVFGHAPLYSEDSSEWQTISWQGTLPAQAVVGYILIKFYNQPDPYHFTRKADIWIDNVQFIQPGIENLVLNGGFENWNVGIDENVLSALSLYPNPSKDYINIDLPEKPEEIFITDLTGKEILRVNHISDRSIRIDVSNYTPGLFFISVLLEDGSYVPGKFVIIK